MSWARTLRRHGWVVEENGVYDPFGMLGAGYTKEIIATGGAASHQRAKVNFGLRTATEFGAISVNASVTIECPQDEGSINLAGELAFRKTLELLNDGASHVGAPKLPPFQEQ